MNMNRREFLKVSAYLATLLGLDAQGGAVLAKGIDKALASKKRLPVIWLHFQECTGCSESFIKSMHPDVSKIVLELISLDYHDTLLAAAGMQAEQIREKAIKQNRGNYILCVEGAIPTKDGGVYCAIGGHNPLDILKEGAEGAKAIIAWGSCASFGGVQAAAPNPTGATPVHEIIKDKLIVNIPGCPPIGEAMAAVVAHYLVLGRLPTLDRHLRPKAFYEKLLHDTCYRRSHFEDGNFAESFDDPRGYCLYELGCKGPITHTSCGVIGHSAGLSFPVRSGHPCLGCTEPNFWDKMSPFYEATEEI